MELKRYKITKIIYAKNFSQAVKLEKDAEIVDIELNQDVTHPEEGISFIGFNCKHNGKRKG